MSATLTRQLPFSSEAEKALLCSMLIGGLDVVGDCREVLTEEAFFDPKHAKMFQLICLALDGGVPLDVISVTEELRKSGLLEELGGAEFVSELFNFVPSAVHFDYYLDVVREKWIARQIIAACTEAVRKAYDETNDVGEVLAETQGKIIDIGQLTKASEMLRPIGERVAEVVETIELIHKRRGHPVGLSTGFVDLDRITGGLQAGRTYYVGARPAMGKSSLGTQLAEHVAIDCAERQCPVAMFSVEMTAHEITEVILCRRASVDLLKLRDGFFSKHEMQMMREHADALKKSAIYIDDSASLTITDFRARARRAVTKLGVKLIIIDYVQRMRSASRRAQQNREQEINEIAQGISETAKELMVPIVVLAQLNRRNEERSDKIPELSDFRESGSLEQEAHFVGLLHRPAYYCRTQGKAQQEAEKYELSLEDFEKLTLLIVAKQRRGPTGVVKLWFDREHARFISEDKDRPLFSNDPQERQEKWQP
jgi:replicative DNA helicase